MNPAHILIALWAIQAAGTVLFVPDRTTRAVLSLIGFALCLIAYVTHAAVAA